MRLNEKLMEGLLQYSLQKCFFLTILYQNAKKNIINQKVLI